MEKPNAVQLLKTFDAVRLTIISLLDILSIVEVIKTNGNANKDDPIECIGTPSPQIKYSLA
jgi:hypothetical protein